MKLAGRIDIAASAPQIWELINDPVGLAACIPGVQDVRQVDDRTFTGGLSASVGPMEGHFTFQAVIETSEFPSALVVQLTGTDSVTSSTLLATVTSSLEPAAGQQSSLVYAATISVKGRLAILGDMILRATASALIGELLKCLKARLERPPIEG